MTKPFLLLASLCLLSACSETWSERSTTDGTPLNIAQQECRAKAQESVRRQMPIIESNYMPGPAGFPPDTPRSIEDRETALCLQQKGFKLNREWR